jgi:DNA repair photolyase
MIYHPGVARVRYVETTCKSAVNRVQGMPFKWSLNPYIGCAHACQYCYARAYYAVADRGDGREDFQTRIMVKTNLPEVLRRELDRPNWRHESIALGTATDVYQPAEGRFRLTRRSLEVLREACNPIQMVTKSPLVIRDLDILADLSRIADARVFFTITTVDLSLWRELEPGTANPFKRLAAMRRLVDAGVPSGVLHAPILPGITDSAESIEAVTRAARDHGAMFFGASTLRLDPTVREHYLDFVGRSYPMLLEKYQRAYVGRHAPPAYRAKLAERLARIRTSTGLAENGMRDRYSPPPGAATIAPRRGRQLMLPTD